MTMCMLEFYSGKLPGEKRLSNPEKLRPSLLHNLRQLVQVFSHSHSFQTSFGSLDRLPLQPCLHSRKVYQGGRDEGHLQTVTVRSPLNIVSCIYERPYVGMHYFVKEDFCVMEIHSGIIYIYIYIYIYKQFSSYLPAFVYSNAPRQKPSRNVCHIFRK